MARRTARSDAYDFIIVGAGSSGCVLASRLSAQARVLVVEAGPWDRDPMIRVPLGCGHILARRHHDWKYFTEKEPGLGGRRIECARGKVVGGCSSTNGMAYVRGHRADYDGWAAMGLPGWSYADVLPYFRRQESWEGGADAYRGGTGPLRTQWTRFEDPLSAASLAAGLALGHPWTEDHNGADQHGFGRWQMTIRNGRRCSAADAYLRPALRRGGLEIVVGALVTRLLFDGAAVCGLEYRTKGGVMQVFAGREVILSAGAINSPQILMLSGLGCPEALRDHDIRVRVPLRGVGANLQDHAAVNLTAIRREGGPLQRAMRFDRIATEMSRAYLFGRGIASDMPFGTMGFVKSGAEALPDLQVMSIAGSPLSKPYLPPFTRPAADTFDWRIALLRPESRGAVTLRSADPTAAPRIRQNLLSTDADLRGLRRGLRMAQALNRQAPLATMVARESLEAETDQEIDAYIRAMATTIHHPVGTCRMGTDEQAVVDTDLRVRGVDRLRVVDASVMPAIVGGNTNAPSMMIAEKAADLILGGPPA
ncbi:GMC family oxidoreductase N-terminal domain-containing protein [Salipiger sp. P9]|uniref:GMC family oxidoreductase n=1 Tax=Salipiger pentaromativorans TaxID=2943193 RepID=UPI0021582787|nr:GMC family oxidoreductase N-terminal domain-containing protein [Salipiger pentaromativorans]MCR8549257.1 GMC family oxidoreductase N-terminal domain-containing protein [Salipiger pentaromativorans]